MPRKPRIEYAGAVYHVMNRGNDGRAVFLDRQDNERFMWTLGIACKRYGWVLHAYVMMKNHFHWLLETPEANLVAGMKWFMGVYSQRFNVRHGKRGHVFQGRYKALPIDVEASGYFETVSTYIHLNPVRAHLLKDEDHGLEQFEWSSYPSYLLSKKERPRWLDVRRVLGNLDLRDGAEGCGEYARYMDERVMDLQSRRGRAQMKEKWKPLRSGWCLGDEVFKAGLQEYLEKRMEGNDRRSYSGAAIRSHDLVEAERLLEKGMKALELSESSLEGLAKGDIRKCLLAWLVHTHTLARHRWIAERLHMGHGSNMTAYITRGQMGQNDELFRLRRKLKRVIPK